MFDEIILDEPQKELLVSFVETQRDIPMEKRGSWMLIQAISSPDHFIHTGATGKRVVGLLQDAEILAANGLLQTSYGSRGTPNFFITPIGFRYYAELMAACTPVEAVEIAVNRHLSAAEFRQEFPEAFDKWNRAQALLWQSDSLTQHTTVGHLCREAMQLFCDALVLKQKPVGAVADKTKTVARLCSVLDARRGSLGKTEVALLEALVSYWGTVSDLAQRQEHGGQREGDALSWEDSRRLVFQTCIVMYEIHRSLQRGAND